MPYVTGIVEKRTWHQIDSDRSRDQGTVFSITEDQSQLHRDSEGEEPKTERRKSQKGKETDTKSSPYLIVERRSKIDSRQEKDGKEGGNTKEERGQTMEGGEESREKMRAINATVFQNLGKGREDRGLVGVGGCQSRSVGIGFRSIVRNWG